VLAVAALAAVLLAETDAVLALELEAAADKAEASALNLAAAAFSAPRFWYETESTVVKLSYCPPAATLPVTPGFWE
jgi:hypothetical protein